MTSGKKVAVTTGASRVTGAAFVGAFRARDYRVVATARSMVATNDADAPTIASDIVNAILYLESAGFVTGEKLHVDRDQSADH